VTDVAVGDAVGDAVGAPWPRRVVEVPGLMDPGPLAYSQCVLAGPLVFVAAQMGVDEHGQVVPGGFAAQAVRSFHNIGLALARVGCGFADVVFMTSYVTDMRHSGELVRIRRDVLGDAPPAGALVGVDELAWPEAAVSIQVTAVRPAAP
jgi:enamine deaminase RidA (YjgF/YER057c/UK114 family)